MSVETLARLRDVMARELETISRYEAHAAAETDPEAKALFQHLADEEKEHVTEVYEALLTRDAAQKQAASGAHASAIREHRLTQVLTGNPGHPVLAPAPSPAAPHRSGIQPSPPTIGSLFGQSQD